MLRDEGIWQHPLVAGAFDDELRARLLAAADRRRGVRRRARRACPTSPRHGDACPNNLLAPRGHATASC